MLAMGGSRRKLPTALSNAKAGREKILGQRTWIETARALFMVVTSRINRSMRLG